MMSLKCKCSSVMPAVHMHNFDSISAAEEDTHKTMLFTHIERNSRS